MPQYEDFAEYYDFDHAVTLDLEFFLDFARRRQSPILELACGTGRVAIPLAEAGFEVYGVDLSERMLAICRDKIEARCLSERIQLILANMTSVDLPRKDFTLAYIALRSFMHLLTQEEQLACLRQVSKHLRPGGYCIVTMIAPDVERLAQKPTKAFGGRREYDLPNGHRVARMDRLVQHDIALQIRHFELKLEEFDPRGTLVRERLVPLYTRYTFRYELQLLLERAGLELVDLFRDYDQNAYDGTGEMIAVARTPQ